MTIFLTSGSRARQLKTRTARKKKAHKLPVYTVTATAYQAVASQTDDEPFVTADNSRIKPRYSSRTRWLALSQDLLAQWGGKFQFGDKVHVRGISPQLDGLYTVHDTMNKRHRHCIDILTHASEKLDIFTKDVKIQLAVAKPARTPVPPKGRARATTVARARLRSDTRRTGIFKAPPQRRAAYFASAIL